MIEKADSDDDDSSNASSDEKVTRDNVIDKVESYEGSTLDTDNYTYKEPEKLETVGDFLSQIKTET